MIEVKGQTEQYLRTGAAELVIRLQITTPYGGAPTDNSSISYYGSSSLTSESLLSVSFEKDDNRIINVGNLSRSAGVLFQAYEVGSVTVTLQNDDGALDINLTPDDYNAGQTRDVSGYMGIEATLDMGIIQEYGVVEWVPMFGGLISRHQMNDRTVTFELQDLSNLLIRRQITDDDSTSYSAQTPSAIIQDLATSFGGLGAGDIDSASFTVAGDTFTDDGFLMDVPVNYLSGQNVLEAMRFVAGQALCAVFFNESGKLAIKLYDGLHIENGPTFPDFDEDQGTLLRVQYHHTFDDVYNRIILNWGLSPGSNGTITKNRTYSQNLYGIRKLEFNAPFLTTQVDAEDLADQYLETLAGFGGAPFFVSVDVNRFGNLVEVGSAFSLSSTSSGLSGELFRCLSKEVSQNGERVRLTGLRTPLEFMDWAYTVVHDLDDGKLVF